MTDTTPAESTALERRAAAVAASVGSAIRERRISSRMTQDQLALATGVGRGFLIDLEAGKSSCRLGLSLLVAEALGLRLTDIIAHASNSSSQTLDLPAPSEEEPETNVPSSIL
jgi:transcriptional regulator with XRE-family HTH domain